MYSSRGAFGRKAIVPEKPPFPSVAGDCPICSSGYQVIWSADHSSVTIRPVTPLPDVSARRPDTVTVSLIADGLRLVVSVRLVAVRPGGGGAPSTASANSAPSFAAPLVFRCTPSAMSVAGSICGYTSTRVTLLRPLTTPGSAALYSRTACCPAGQ